MTRGLDWLSDATVEPVPVLWCGEEKADDVKAEFVRFSDLQMDESLVHVVRICDVCRRCRSPSGGGGSRCPARGGRSAGRFSSGSRTISTIRPATLSPGSGLSRRISRSSAFFTRTSPAVNMWAASVRVAHAICCCRTDWPDRCDVEHDRELTVTKSRNRDIQQQGETYHLAFDCVRYAKTAPPPPKTRAKEAPSREEVWQHMRENPGIGKTAARQALRLLAGRHGRVQDGLGSVRGVRRRRRRRWWWGWCRWCRWWRWRPWHDGSPSSEASTDHAARMLCR